MPRVKKLDLGMTALDELFMNDKERAKNKLLKIFDIPLSEIDDFPDPPTVSLMMRICRTLSPMTAESLRLTNIGALSERQIACKEQLDDTKVQLENAKAESQKPFPHEEELKTKSARLAELNTLLDMDKRDNELVDGERGDDAEEPDRSNSRDAR